MNTARALTARLADLLAREHGALADFLLALADFDRRRLWVELGHASLFYYLHRELGLSKGAAHYRKVAAELVQRFPEIVEPLRDGRLCVTSIVELAKVLTPENRDEVVPRFFHRSKREAMAVAAEIRPAEAAPHRTVVTTIRAEPPLAPSDARRAPSAPDLRHAPVQPVEPRADRQNQAPVPVPTDGSRSRRDVADPVTADLSRFHVTVSRRFLAKLEAARAALSHTRPGATEGEILEAGLDLVLAAHAKRKALVEKPRKAQRPASSNTVPAEVKRAVWLRDGGRCQWPLDGGGVCGSTLRAELDHIEPKARGGAATIENLRVVCGFHNDLAARQAFGDAWMDRFTHRGRAPAAVGAAPPAPEG